MVSHPRRLASSAVLLLVSHILHVVCVVWRWLHIYVFRHLLNVTKFQQTVTWLKVCVCVVALLLNCSPLNPSVALELKFEYSLE